MNQKQAKEVLALIEKAQFHKAFAKLDSFGVNDFAVNSLREEFKTGHEGAKFHQRLAVVVQGLAIEMDNTDPEEPEYVVRKKTIYVSIFLGVLAILLTSIGIWYFGKPSESGGLGGNIEDSTKNKTAKQDTAHTKKYKLETIKEIVSKLMPKMVSIPNQNYHIAETEVTQELWLSVMGYNPSKFNDCAKCPVDNVSYDEVVEKFLKKLNEIMNENYTLPDRLQWQYAAKGAGSFRYANDNVLDNVGWYAENSEKRTHKVGKKAPNGYKLYDMNGNVSEWVLGEQTYTYINGGKIKARYACGGAWHTREENCTNLSLISYTSTEKHPSIGFRLCKQK